MDLYNSKGNFVAHYTREDLPLTPEIERINFITVANGGYIIGDKSDGYIGDFTGLKLRNRNEFFKSEW